LLDAYAGAKDSGEVVKLQKAFMRNRLRETVKS
jgi:hypothetical protein